MQKSNMLKYKVVGLGIIALLAIAAGTCPQSKDGNAQCCSTSAKSCNTTINWPAGAKQKVPANNCTEVTCDSIRVPKSCTGPNSDKKCTVNADSVTQTLKLYSVIIDANGNCDCSATVLATYANIINCNTATNGDNVDPACGGSGG